MWKLWIFFRADLPERKKRFPSWAGAEKFAADVNFGEKKRHSCCDWSRTLPDRSDQPSLRSMKGVTVVTPLGKKKNKKQKTKKTVKPQTDTKTQWNTLQVSPFYSFHLRKNKV